MPALVKAARSICWMPEVPGGARIIPTGERVREEGVMLCTWPKCDCKLKLAVNQLYPKVGDCPKGEEIKADLDLLALSHDLYQLLMRSPHVWESPERCTTLEQDVERLERIVAIARNMYRRRCCAHT